MKDKISEPLFDIVEGCKRGERKCQHELYKNLYGKMFGICLRYGKGYEEARDLLQEGFVKIFLSIKSFSGTGSFEGWARKIMVNTAIDFFRKSRNIPEYAHSELVENKAGEIKEAEPENQEYMNLHPNEIMEAVQKLSPSYKMVFNLYVMDGYTHKEIAQQLGISEGTSKSNYAKAKINLRKMLERKLKIYQD